MKWLDIMKTTTSVLKLMKTKTNNSNQGFEKKDMTDMNSQIRINGIMGIYEIMGMNQAVNTNGIM